MSSGGSAAGWVETPLALGLAVCASVSDCPFCVDCLTTSFVVGCVFGVALLILFGAKLSAFAGCVFFRPHNTRVQVVTPQLAISWCKC